MTRVVGEQVQEHVSMGASSDDERVFITHVGRGAEWARLLIRLGTVLHVHESVRRPQALESIRDTRQVSGVFYASHAVFTCSLSRIATRIRSTASATGTPFS